MYELMVVVFVIGYACITIEHQLKVDKAAIALITGILCWTIYVFGKEEIVQLDKIKNYAETEFTNIYPDEIVETSESIGKSTKELKVKGEGITFYSQQEVRIAYNEKKVDLHAIIKLRHKQKIIETTVGRSLFNELLPEGAEFVNELLTKKSLRSIIEL